MKGSVVFWLIGLLATSTVPFLPGLTSEFVFDDAPAVLNNKDLYSSSLSGVLENDFWGGNLSSPHSHKSYRPVTTFTYWLQIFLTLSTNNRDGNQSDKLSAVSFKAVNLILNCVVTLLLFRYLTVIASYLDISPPQGRSASRKKSTTTWNRYALCCLMFSLHPVHVEPVVSVVGRADLLYSAIYLIAASVYSYQVHLPRNRDASGSCPVENDTTTDSITNKPTKDTLSFNSTFALTSRLIGFVVLASLATFSKEQGITVFLLTATTDVVITITKCQSHRLPYSRIRWKKFIAINTFLGAVCAAVAYARLRVANFQSPRFQKFDNPAAFQPKVWQRILNYHHVYVYNLWLLVCPDKLSFDWSFSCVSLIKDPISDWRSLSLVLLWMFFVSVAYRIMVHLPRISSSSCHDDATRQFFHLIQAMLLIIVPFLMASNVLVHVGFVIAERNLYLSTAGYCLLVTTGLDAIKDRLRSARTQQWLHVLFLALVICPLAAKTALQSGVWQQHTTLYQSGLRTCPNNAKIYYNIAKRLVDKEPLEARRSEAVSRHNHNLNLAITFYKEAVRQEPLYEHALNNLGNLLKSVKRPQEAEAVLRLAVWVNPKFAAAHMNLAIVEQSLGEMDKAEKNYLNALNLRSPYPDCEYNLGNLYLKMRRYPEAERFFRIAAQHNQAKAFTNLLILLEDLGRGAESVELALAGLRRFPDNPDIYFHLANQYGQMAEYEKSETEYLKAINIAPRANYYANLGVLYHRWKKFTKATESYQTALQIDPRHLSARSNLDSLQRLH